MSYGLDLVQAQASQIIPYIAWVQNQVLFNNDLMGMTFPYYGSFSLWYKAAGWLGTFFSPMEVVYIFFVVQCFLEVFALNFFAHKLFPDKPFTYRLTVIVVFTFGGVFRYSLGSVAPFGWTVFPDALATGLLLFACGYLLEKRFITAILITALVFNIHLGLSSFMLLVLICAYFLSDKKYTLKHILYTGLVSGILMLPVLVMMLMNPNAQLSLPYNEWLQIFKIHQGMHAFPSQFGLFQYVPFAFWMILLVTAVKFLQKSDRLSMLLKFCYAIIVVLITAFIFIEILENRYAITLSFFRGSRFLTLAGACCITAVLFEIGQHRNILRKLLHTAGITAVFIFIFLNILVFHPAYRIYPDFVKNYLAELEKNDHLVSTTLLFRTIKDDRDYVKAWKDVQVWCKNNTPENTLLLTPFHIRGFRSFSERNIFFQYRDAPLMTYYYVVYDELMKRVRMIDISIKDLPTPTEFQLFVKDIYQNYTAEDVKKLAEELPIQYIVTEYNHTLDLPEMYRNSHFTVYRLNEIRSDK